jgi:hypothetical protein
MPEKLNYRFGLYPVIPNKVLIDRSFKARWTGEKRCPKKGEYFLSGAIIAACEAFSDMQTEYHIAEIVETETITATRVVERR